MEELLTNFVRQLSGPLLAGMIVVAIGVLGKSADWLVGEAIALSERSGVPKVVIGATIVSLGTTTPEAVVSVLAAIQGRPGLAMGNAVGSIICDTGLILGLACLIAPLPLDRRIVNRQGWIQMAAGILLVLSCWPWSAPAAAFQSGGQLSQATGFLFLFLLAAYMAASIYWARQGAGQVEVERVEARERDLDASPFGIVLKLLTAILLVVGASWVLIPAVAEAAARLNVPESIIAATMVAFGTSLPELVTSVTAALRGHGELAVGNVVGADILNVLFVAGAAAAVTTNGLEVPSHFFTLYFPSMILVLLVFRVGIFVSGDKLKRPFGFVLLATYVAVTILSYVQS